MTDRVHTLTVVLKEDIREDDIDVLLSAISLFPQVLSVSTHVSDITSHMAERRAKLDVREHIYSLLESLKQHPHQIEAEFKMGVR